MTIAVILNFRQLDLTLQCIKHTRSQEGVHVLVVDNGSGDGSAAKLASGALASGELLALDRNLGFAGGMNAGIRAALDRGADAVWLLNNDAFPAIGCLDRLLQALDSAPRLGMVTPRILIPDGSEQHVGGIVDWSGLGNGTLLDARQFQEEEAPDRWITGCAPLIRAESLKEVGLFEDSFFAYWEDVDLSVRMTRAGWRLGCCENAVVTHIGGASSGGLQSEFVESLILRNHAFLVKRHQPESVSRVVRWRIAARIAGRIGDRRAEYGGLKTDHLIGALYSVVFQHYSNPNEVRIPNWFRRMASRSAYRWQSLFERLAGHGRPA